MDGADILLEDNGDIYINKETGDITLVSSIRQAVMIRLRWILGEWRLGPGIGLPWFEEILVKKPNVERIKTTLCKEILKTDGVLSAEITEFEIDNKTRVACVRFRILTTESDYWEEAEIYV